MVTFWLEELAVSKKSKLEEEKKKKNIDRHEYFINEELLIRWQNRILNTACGQYHWQNSNLLFIVIFPLHNDKYFNSLAEYNVSHIFIFIVLTSAYFRSFDLQYI